MDEAGRFRHSLRLDGTPNASVVVAIGKALHAVTYWWSTVFHQGLLKKGTMAVLSLPASLLLEKARGC